MGGASCARIYPVFLRRREIGEKQDNGILASGRPARIILQPRNCHHCCFFFFFSSFCTFVTNWSLFSHKYFPSYPVHPKSVASNYLGNVIFCNSLPNLSMTADSRTTLRAILFQLMKPSRPEVGEKKIMVQEGGGGGRSYYDHVIPNIIAFVLHHWMEKAFS